MAHRLPVSNTLPFASLALICGLGASKYKLIKGVMNYNIGIDWLIVVDI